MIREIDIIDGWQMIVRLSIQHAVSVTTRSPHLRILTNELGTKMKKDADNKFCSSKKIALINDKFRISLLD